MTALLQKLTQTSKSTVLQDSITYWNPDKVKAWAARGVDLVIGRRERYFLYDMSGHRLFDMHLNGGTFNLRTQCSTSKEPMGRASWIP